jgi:phage-related minor tail protein
VSDDRVDVSISISSDKAEQGAAKAADSLGKAVAQISAQLDKLIATSAASGNAMAAGFQHMSSEVNNSMNSIASSFRRTATIVDDYGNEVTGVNSRVASSNREVAAGAEAAGHASVGARRELLVLAHELATGNFKRAAGSLMVLGERLDWMGKIMSPTGAAIGLVAGALAAFAGAAIVGARQMQRLQESLVLTGDYAGVTTGQFIEMGDRIADSTGTGINKARDALAQVAATGRFTGQALQPVAEAVAKIGQYSDATSEEVVKSFEKMDEGVYKWALNYNEQYHFATMAQLEHIRALEEQGRKEEAEAETANLVIDKLKETANQLGYLPGILTTVGNAWHRFWDAAMDVGRPVTIEDRLTNLRTDLANNVKQFGDSGYNGSADQQRRNIRQLEQQRDEQQDVAGRAATTEKVQQEGAKAVETMRSEWKGLGGDVDLANEAVQRFRNTIASAQAAAKAGGTPLPPDILKMIQDQPEIEARIRKQYDKQDFVTPKKPKGQVTPGEDNSLEMANTNAQLAILKEGLKEQEDELEKAYRAGRTSLQYYYSQRLQITLAGMDAEAAAMRKQLQATQALESSSATDPAQRISLKTKEIDLTSKLNVLEMQRADAVRASSQAESAALADQTKGLQDEAAKETQFQLQETQKRELLVAQEQERSGQITKQQLLNMEMQYNDQLAAADVKALQQRLDTERDLTLLQKQQIQDQIYNIDAQNQTKNLALQQQALQQQGQLAQTAASDIENDFTKAFTQIATRTKTVQSAFEAMITEIENQMTQLISKDLFNQLFNGSAGGSGSGIGSITSLLQNGIGGLFGGGGGAGFDASGAFGFSSAATGSSAAVAAGAESGGTEGMSALMGLASFAVGTPYVPGDMIAQIHQGEAIIPAHMNSPNSSVSVTNQFNVAAGTDLRTQSQMAAMAGASIQNAMRRNG